MAKDKKISLGVKLKLITLVPLIIGILLASVIFVSLLFDKHTHWLYDMRSDLVARSKNLLVETAHSRRSTIETYLSNSALYEQFLRGIYDSIDAGNITLTSDITVPSYVNGKDTSSSGTYPDTTKSVYMSPTNTDPSQSTSYNELKLLDILMRVIYEDSNDPTLRQIGVAFTSDGLDYRYPVQDMSDLSGTFNYSSTCSQESASYDVRCTQTYYNLKNGVNGKSQKLMIYYENKLVNAWNNPSYGAFAFYTDNETFTQFINEIEYVTTFISEKDGTWTLGKDEETIDDFQNKKLGDILFPEESDLADRVITNLLPLMHDSVDILAKLYGMIATDYVAVSPANVTMTNVKYTEYQDSYTVGLYKSRTAILIDWNKFITTVVDIITGQTIVFAVLLFMTIVSSILLNKALVYKITHPITVIIQDLESEKGSSRAYQLYNKEINEIFKYVELTNLSEKFIDPSFLKNPKPDERIANLKEARRFFKRVNNKRGVSIANNLIGNIHYRDQDYDKAVKYYQKALQAMEDLEKIVLLQEEEEAKLTEEEKENLRKKTGKITVGWEEEKAFLKENICERILQLCMGKQMGLLHGTRNLMELRSDWKDLLNLQSKVVQVYFNARTHYLRILKILVDLALAFQSLQYFHSALEILEIVEDELNKLETLQHPDIDIDIVRLKRLGVNINEEEGVMKLHFAVPCLDYEKDILRQMILHRRGMILKETDRFQEAGYALTEAIENGGYFDPYIRQQCLAELIKMMKKFAIKTDIDELYSLHKDFASQGKAMLFLLRYNFNDNSKLNRKLVNFITNELNDPANYIGASTMSLNSTIKLDIEKRDMAGIDLENMIMRAKSISANDHPYDLIMKWHKLFPDKSNEKYTIMILKDLPFSIQIAKEDDLAAVIDKTMKYIVIPIGFALPTEFEKYLSENNGYIIEIQDDSSIDEALEAVKRIMG